MKNLSKFILAVIIGFFALCLSISLVRGQTTTLITYKDTTFTSRVTIPIYTITITKVVHDTLAVDTLAILAKYCKDDSVVTPVSPKMRILYVGSEFATIFKSASQGLAFKKYLKDYKYNGVSYFGLGSISSGDWPILRAFNEDLRNNYGIILIEATGGSSSTFIGARSQFNNGCSNPKQRFDRFNMEREYWNAKDASGNITDASVKAEWLKDSVEMTKSFNASHQINTEFVWYHGWPLKWQLPLHLVNSQDVIMYHDYTATPSTGYLNTRATNANAAQKILDPNKKKDFIVLVSGENAFMLNWFRTHSLDELDAIFKPFINGFSHLNYKGLQVFMYSNMTVSQPPKTAPGAAMFRMVINPKDTVTAKSHLEMAIPRD